MTDIPSLAQVLASYGGWGLSAVLMVVCGVLYRALMACKDDRIDDAREIMKVALEMRGDHQVTAEVLRLLGDKRHR